MPTRKANDLVGMGTDERRLVVDDAPPIESSWVQSPDSTRRILADANRPPE
jgi:hypothetical protein